MRPQPRNSAPARSGVLTRLREQQGQSAVEIALMLPLLMILVFGIITSGFMLYATIQVSNGAREGARAGSLYRTVMGATGYSLDITVYKAVYDSSTGKSALGGLPVTSSNPTVLVSSTGDKAAPRPGDQITVRLTYSYTQPIISAFVPIFPQPLVIQRTIVMEMQ